MPVETAALRDIIKTVDENDAAKANFNLYFFHKPEKSATNVNVFKSMEENRYSQQLSTMQHVNLRECPYCFKSISTDQQGSFCNFCGGIFPKKLHEVVKINVATSIIYMCISAVETYMTRESVIKEK